MDKIAVLVPCYNESQTVEKVVTDFQKALPEAVVYVYDNNSKDDTAAIAARCGAVVRHEYQQGKGNVIRRMFCEIDAQCYIMIEYRDRPQGSVSKLNTYSDGFKVLMMIARMFKNYKPMGFFGLLALLLAIISLIFFIPVFAAYLSTGLVERFPTLICCGFLALAAILSLFAGLILSVIRQSDRQRFESDLQHAREVKAGTPKQ